MDFFMLQDSNKWNDAGDDNQLHTDLFHPSTSASPQKVTKEKKQTNSLEFQIKQKRKMGQEKKKDLTCIKKQKKDHPQEPELMLQTQVKDTENIRGKLKVDNHRNLFQGTEDQGTPPQNTSKKKRKRKNTQRDNSELFSNKNQTLPKKPDKRKKRNSQGDSIGDNQDIKQTVSSNTDQKLSAKHYQGNKVTRNTAQTVLNKQHDEREDKGESDKSKKKMKRKRKAKNNKFKDVDGNLKEQYRKQPESPDDQKSAPSNSIIYSASSSLAITKPTSGSGSVNSQRNKNRSSSKSEKQVQANISFPNKVMTKKHIQVMKKSSDSQATSKQSNSNQATAKKPNQAVAKPTVNQANVELKKKTRNRKRKKTTSESIGKDLVSQDTNPENEDVLNSSEAMVMKSSLMSIADIDGNLKAVAVLKNDANQSTSRKQTHEETGIVKPNTKTKQGESKQVKSRKQLKRQKNKLAKIAKATKLLPTSASRVQDLAEELPSKEDLKEDKGQSMRSRLENQLRASHFRFINEKFYMCTGEEAYEMMTQDADAFQIYHECYSQQVQQWPANPVDVMIKYLNSRPSNLIVGDFGCGEAQIAQTVKQKVHSFDLCALNKYVTVCDMAKVPLEGESLDVAVFCLSLMGTNWIAYLKEANRLLKTGGILKIAEVASRFQSLAGFVKVMKSLGFQSTSKDLTNKMFYLFEFSKKKPFRDIQDGKGDILKPCLYKKR